MKTIYLAGPITGLSYGEARHGWRTEFERLFLQRDPEDAHILSPMRGKEALSNVKRLSANRANDENYMSTNKAIVTRDYNDVSNCHVMVANLRNTKQVSIGTCIEFGFAHANRTPIVLIMEKNGNPHLHGFILEIAGYWVQTLEEAVDVVIHVIGGGL